ncbi:RNU1 U1 small nuclear ribonucleoprotein 70 kDa [Candida maltosa Xu316]
MEREFMRDPLKTVFIARLDYNLTEIEISKAFSSFGVIQSVRVIRDKQGKSRGYGFIVYERIGDAQSCVNNLSRNGLKVGNRTILVDIERSRIINTWKPRRLGGGEGGRGRAKDGRNSSVAASGRRTHIANNPSLGIVPPQSRPGQYNQYQAPSHYQSRTQSGPRSYDSRSSPAASSYSYKPTSNDRSIRSIRRND